MLKEYSRVWQKHNWESGSLTIMDSSPKTGRTFGRVDDMMFEIDLVCLLLCVCLLAVCFCFLCVEIVCFVRSLEYWLVAAPAGGSNLHGPCSCRKTLPKRYRHGRDGKSGRTSKNEGMYSLTVSFYLSINNLGFTTA